MMKEEEENPSTLFWVLAGLGITILSVMSKALLVRLLDGSDFESVALVLAGLVALAAGALVGVATEMLESPHSRDVAWFAFFVAALVGAVFSGLAEAGVVGGTPLTEDVFIGASVAVGTVVGVATSGLVKKAIALWPRR